MRRGERHAAYDGAAVNPTAAGKDSQSMDVTRTDRTDTPTAPQPEIERPTQRRNGVHIGFVLSAEQFPAPELVRLGKRAEEAGFDMVWTSDHFHPWQENQGHASFAWATLAALSQHVERIPFGTGVTCPSFRYHPQVVAQGFATLAQLHPGKVYLGVGAGEALNEIPAGEGWGDYTERSTRLAEAVELIRQLWTGEWTDFAGKYYLARHARLYDAPPIRIPIYMAAGGPKSVRLAGEYGDGMVTDAQRALQPDLRAIFEEGARAGGKDPQALPILAEHMVVVGDREEAERYAPLWRFMPHSWDRYVTDPDPISIQRRAEADIPLDQVYGKWPVSADAQPHIEELRKLADGGVTHIFVHSPQADQRRVIDFYAREVLPQV
jgi:TAT-translocated FGD2 family F420-dependent dehydrogenase